MMINVPCGNLFRIKLGFFCLCSLLATEHMPAGAPRPSDPLAKLLTYRVNQTIQDRHGIFWFAAQEGLVRFDGSALETYEHDETNPNSLSATRVRVLYEDRAGRLWVGATDGGLNRFDREKKRFQRFRHDPDRPESLANDQIRTILEDRAGNLWIGTFGGGLDMFSPATKTFIHHQSTPDDPQSLSHNNVTSLVEDRAGNLWSALSAAVSTSSIPKRAVPYAIFTTRRISGALARTISSTFAGTGRAPCGSVRSRAVSTASIPNPDW